MADPLAAAVVEQLRQRGLTLATAETDTGGLIGSLITDVPGCSVAYRGSIVPYHAKAQHTLLGVPTDTLRNDGSVSEETALALARGCRDALTSDIAISETGITGPTGGRADRPIGTVWLACVGPDDRVAVERHVWDNDREGNKARTAQRALELVQEAIADSASSRDDTSNDTE